MTIERNLDNLLSLAWMQIQTIIDKNMIAQVSQSSKKSLGERMGQRVGRKANTGSMGKTWGKTTIDPWKDGSRWNRSWGVVQGYWGIVLLLAVWLGLGMPPAQGQDFKVNYTLADVSGQDWSGRNLEGTSLAGATLRYTNLAGANLRGTILTKANFEGANLEGVDFTGAFADRVNFNQTNLRDAVVVGLIATGTSFDGADITGADFSVTILDRYQTFLLCQRASGVNPTTGLATRASLGCR
jgi:hypothetical protein